MWRFWWISSRSVWPSIHTRRHAHQAGHNRSRPKTAVLRLSLMLRRAAKWWTKSQLTGRRKAQGPARSEVFGRRCLAATINGGSTGCLEASLSVHIGSLRCTYFGSKVHVMHNRGAFPHESNDVMAVLNTILRLRRWVTYGHRLCEASARRADPPQCLASACYYARASGLISGW
jgi:hypothetical protein